ncbi:hypothetical protein CPBF426_03220 [Xanthomonas arboricola pv. juglandis]|nr:hypothetical protein CPBF426_03220 [Xanthomonas arboricola pv. juglandis]
MRFLFPLFFSSYFFQQSLLLRVVLQGNIKSADKVLLGAHRCKEIQFSRKHVLAGNG